MGRKINRGRLVHDGTRRPDPEAILQGLLGPKDKRDQLMVATLVHQAILRLHKETGLEIAHSVVQQVHRSALVMFKHMPRKLYAELAMKVPRHAASILKAMDLEDARHCMVAVAYLAMHLAEDGTLKNPDCQAVLASMAVLEEAKEDGRTGPWDFRPQLIAAAAGKARNAAQLIGYF